MMPPLPSLRQNEGQSRLTIAALGLLMLVLSGCGAIDRIDVGSRGNVHPYAPNEFGEPDAAKPVAPIEYRIGPLDTVTITVFQIADISGDRSVSSQGNLDLPLVGSVHAAGLTTAELRSVLEKRLGERYLKDPHVEVTMKQALGAQFTVDGSVKSPGVYPVQGKTTLLQAIATAHGLDQGAIPSRVAIFRTIKGQRMAAGFDLTKIRKGLQPDPDVYGSDIIVVDGSTTRSDYRDILKSLPLLAIFGII